LGIGGQRQSAEGEGRPDRNTQLSLPVVSGHATSAGRFRPRRDTCGVWGRGALIFIKASRIACRAAMKIGTYTPARGAVKPMQ